MPLKPDVLEKDGLTQFPPVFGGEVMVVNLPGIKPGQMTLDGPTIADIYLGKITKWDDPAIAKLNPGLKLPSTAIAVVYRSDGSGTTFIFTDYLSKVSPEWKDKVSEGTSVQWPVGIGGKGNEGVSAITSRTVGGIRAAEQAYPHQADQSRRRGAGAEHRRVSGRRGPCGLADGTRLLPDPDQSAGQRHLADHRSDVHSDA
jgi:phosphate transport system substrate-binding protein